jgi:hypothetical protein
MTECHFGIILVSMESVTDGREIMSAPNSRGYQISARSKALLEKLTMTYLVQKCRTLYRIQNFIAVFSRGLDWTVS